MAKSSSGKGKPNQKRAILARLAKRPATIEALADAKLVVLRFGGERQIRCEAALIAQWLSSGAVAMDGDLLKLTKDGQKHLVRLQNTTGAPAHLTQQGVVASRPTSDDGKDGLANWKLIDLNESPLARLAQMRAKTGGPWLEACELAAGERLRCEFERAQLRQRVTMSYDPAHSVGGSRGTRNGQDDLAQTALDARKRVTDALDAMGPELGEVALDVCCFLKGLEALETERNWPRRSAKLMLKTALAALARHYFPVARGPDRARAILQWGSDDFRPALTG